MPHRSTQLVSLTGTGARAFLWLYFAATAALALWTLPDTRQPVLVIVVLALYAGMCLAIHFDDGQLLSIPATLPAITVGPVSVLVLSWHLVPGGYTAWYVGAATAALFLVNLRGRILLAWVGCALFVAAVLIAGATSSLGLPLATLIATRQSAVVAVGTLAALGLRRTGERIREVTAEASVRGAAEAAGAAIAQERARRLAELRTSVVPLLQRIASSPISAEDRSEFAVAEAELRDGLRARGLRIPEVTEAARAARRRGVDVVLLDDSDGQAPEGGIHEFASVVAEVLHSAVDGRVTARLLPPGRPLLGTVVADGSSYVSHEVAR